MSYPGGKGAAGVAQFIIAGVPRADTAGDDDTRRQPGPLDNSGDNCDRDRATSILALDWDQVSVPEVLLLMGANQ